MLVRIIKVLIKLFSTAYIAEKIREKIFLFIAEFQHTIRVQIKKIGFFLVFVGFIFVLFSLGLRFLFLGLAYWLNTLLNSSFLGFFIISAFCFLLAVFAVLFRKKTGNRPEQQETNINGDDNLSSLH